MWHGHCVFSLECTSMTDSGNDAEIYLMEWNRFPVLSCPTSLKLHINWRPCFPLAKVFVHLFSRCSGSTAKSLLFRFLPILIWLPRYPVKEWLLGDIISGFSVGIMHLPQGMLSEIFLWVLGSWETKIPSDQLLALFLDLASWNSLTDRFSQRISDAKAIVINER